MGWQVRSAQWSRFFKKSLYLGVLSFFFVLAFANSVRAIWVDADGSGRESINVSNSPGDSDKPSVYLDKSGNPYIVWEDSSTGNSNIYFLKWDGTEWVDADGSGQESKNISDNTEASGYPSICLDSLGNPHVAWHNHDYASFNNEIYYLKWDGEKKEWVDADGSGQESINISKTQWASYYPSLCLDSSGNPHIAWKDFISENNYDIYYLKWDDVKKEWVDTDGSGRESINVSTNTTYSGVPSLSIDNSGNPHIAWMDSDSNYEIYYLKWDDVKKGWVDADGSGQESINVSSSTVDSKYLSFCLDSLGNPHIAWDEETTTANHEIYYLKWDDVKKEWVDADGSGKEQINISDNSGHSGYPSLRLDISGNPHIAWFDRTPGSPEIYYLKWNGTAWVDVDGSGEELRNISNTSGDSTVPSLYLDSSGNPHIAWRDNTSGNDEIYYLKWNIAPTLSWTGESNYTADGLHPEAGYPNTDFVYRVKYTDQDNHPPASGYPKLHIKKGGTEIAGSPFPMTKVDAGDNYSDGKLYTYNKSGLAEGTDYTYYFEAKDIWNTLATGEPINAVDAPDVTNRVPTLSWTGETNYIDDGLNPESGTPNTTFFYMVKYTDQDNEAPATG